MKGLMVILITGVMAVGAAGCAAASAYKFSCDKGICNVETSGPATLDLEQEFGETLEVVETGENRTTMAAGSARKTLKMGETGQLGPMKVTVQNIKGEQAFFTVQ
ncbi:hypothetical protein OJ998_29255 [Solirubrobacter taibaiensis]|nr:hypothetical protein [Solirubrobacter taibaiensis]